LPPWLKPLVTPLPKPKYFWQKKRINNPYKNNIFCAKYQQLDLKKINLLKTPGPGNNMKYIFI